MSLNSSISIRNSLVWSALQNTYTTAISKCFPLDVEALHPIRASMQLAIILGDDHHCWETFTNRFHHSILFIKNFYLFLASYELKLESVKTIKWHENACLKHKSYLVCFQSSIKFDTAILLRQFNTLISRFYAATEHRVRLFGSPMPTFCVS